MHPTNRAKITFGVILLLIAVNLTDVSLSSTDHINKLINSPNFPISNQIMHEFYISPKGNDNSSGNLSHPFQTISGAQKYVRNLVPNMTGDIIVNLMEGTYSLLEGLQFNQSDSGQNGFNVIYRSELHNKVIISGGKTIEGWNLYQNGIWMAHSPISDFRQLYVNDQRAIRARGKATMFEKIVENGHRINDSSIISWNNFRDIEFVYKELWTLPRIHPDSYRNGIIYMQQPAFSAAQLKGVQPLKNPVWIENAFELLDEPGEWYFNRTNGIVYYIPRNGEDMTTAHVVVPSIQTILAVEGNSTDKIRNLQFQGLEFQYGTWLEPNQYGAGFVDIQANYYYYYWDGLVKNATQTPGNVIVNYAQNIIFENCTFRHLGATGLDLQRGTNQTKIVGNVFDDISGIAIQIGEVDEPFLDPDHPAVVRDNLIINNYIHNCSVEYRGGPGIFACYVRNVRIEHNTLSNLAYTGISLGWGWSGALTVCANNSVKYNRIYGVMSYLWDGGGIYTLSTQPGTNISYNVIYDSCWAGLYADERTNATTWTYNVVFDCYNTFQNHIMFYNEIEDPWDLNNISYNYFDEYTFFGGPTNWEGSDEEARQFWNIGPGHPDFPQWIVDQSGVEPEYASLIPENEWYHRFNVGPVEFNSIGANNILKGVIIFGILAFMGIGVVIMIKIPKNMQNKINGDEPHNAVD